jgi:1-acyl-sn-glycerol-3-phosphate acyltransferase
LPIRILGTLDGFNDPLSKILAKLGIIRLVYFMYGVAGIKSAWTFEEKIAPLVDALKHGDTVLIFPEGKLGRGDTVSTFRRGVAYLYNQTMARILPAAINFNFNGHGDRAIVIGAPTRIPEKIIVKEDYDNSYYQESCEYLRRIVLSLYRFR